jgi:uncharacterized protein
MSVTCSRWAMAGSILESYVVSQVVKSWRHHGKDPSLYHYRDKDGKEVDLLTSHDGCLYPIEVKRAATIRPGDVASFAVLERRGAKTAAGAVLSLSPERIPINRSVDNIPIGWL